MAKSMITDCWGDYLKPKILVNKKQKWFWSKESLEGEKEAEEDIRKGRVKKFKKVDDLMQDLGLRAP